MYRRSVWLEKWVEDCYRDTGKPPLPVRWVKTNKGDKMDPKVRCRLLQTPLPDPPCNALHKRKPI